MELTGTAPDEAAITVTVQSAVLVPSAWETAVMAAVPAPTAVTAPLLTVATAELLEDQVIVLFPTYVSGSIVAVNVVEFPTARVSSDGDTVIVSIDNAAASTVT
jgi:hypothetical protein